MGRTGLIAEIAWAENWTPNRLIFFKFSNPNNYIVGCFSELTPTDAQPGTPSSCGVKKAPKKSGPCRAAGCRDGGRVAPDEIAAQRAAMGRWWGSSPPVGEPGLPAPDSPTPTCYAAFFIAPFMTTEALLDASCKVLDER